MDNNYHTTCPRVLYRANDDRKVFPKIHLDKVDNKHVYVAFQNQVGLLYMCVVVNTYVKPYCYNVAECLCFVVDEACTCVKVQHIQNSAGMLVCTGSTLCLVWH